MDGFAEPEIGEAVEFMRQKSAFAKTGQRWEEFAPLLERAAKTTWFPYAGSPMQEDSWGWKFFRLINDHDPIPILERIHCPVLALFGELDRNVVPAINAPLLEAALRRAGNHQVMVKVFPKANHGLFDCQTGGLKELPLLRRYVPGYVDTLFEWLDATASLRTR
jgi:pimeloyl-ACP methyl ester carboxylesterase